MNLDSQKPDGLPDESLPAAWIEALRTLPSEQLRPGNNMDNLVMAIAASKMTQIRRRRLLRYGKVSLAAVASLALVFAALLLDPSDQDLSPSVSTEDPHAVILREVSKVFPHQIKAIFSEKGELRIALTEQEYSEPSQAVVLEVSSDGELTTVITYVGRTIEIGNRQVTIRRNQNGGIVLDDTGKMHSSKPSPESFQIKLLPI